MFSHYVRALPIFLVICALSLPVLPAHGQDQVEPLPAKPQRDLPNPPAPETAPPAETAALPALPHLLPDVLAAGAANSEDNADSPIGDVGQWSRLAYQSLPTGNWDIFAANGDGSAPRNLSNHPAADARPQLNLDGTRVVFNSERDGNAEIYTVNADGSAINRLTYTHAADYSPAWSPDSQRIAFFSNRFGDRQIFVMDTTGQNVVNISNVPWAEYDPIWVK